MKVKDTAQAYCGVLEHVLTITTKAGEPGKERLTILSKKVAESVGDLVKEAEQLKGWLTIPSSIIPLTDSL